MSNQIKTQIGKLGRIITGKTPPTKVIEYFGYKYPFITPSDISDYSIKSGIKKRINGCEDLLHLFLW